MKYIDMSLMDSDGQMCVYYTCVRFDTNGTVCRSAILQVRQCLTLRGTYYQKLYMARIVISQCSNTLKPFDTNVADDIAYHMLTASLPIN